MYPSLLMTAEWPSLAAGYIPFTTPKFESVIWFGDPCIVADNPPSYALAP
jgi:hypothetical protein